MPPRLHPLRLGLAGLVLALVPHGSAAPTGAAAAGEVSMIQRSWGRGSVPSLTFTLTSGRNTPLKVVAFLYTSQKPEAFLTHTYLPQFVGVFQPPASVRVAVDRPPFRARPIDENSREYFVQGALFDYYTGAPLDVTNEDYIDIVYEGTPTIHTLDFETEDDGSTPLVNGQDLSTPPEFGQLVSISALQPAGGTPHQGPAIFDTDPAGPNDYVGAPDKDLLVGLGNAVILQESAGQSTPGIFTVPDDAAGGGSIVFDFTGFAFIEKVAPLSIDLIDLDSASSDVRVFLTDVLGHRRIYTCPNGWTGDVSVHGPPGYGTLDLTTLLPQPGLSSTATVSSPPNFLPGEVVRIEIALSGSGAVDNLVFAREDDPIAPLTGATNPGSRPVRKLR